IDELSIAAAAGVGDVIMSPPLKCNSENYTVQYRDTGELVEFLGYWYTKEAHDGSFSRPYTHHVMIKNYARDYDIAKRVDSIVQVRNRVRQNIDWKPPELDRIVVNTDGATTSAGSCGCGGVVRDNNGEWVEVMREAYEIAVL
ncbi:hypothetical protein A2U01_0004214, partial [Trifolium medium]|nr:hypothetical protein [Trifolium medium]